MQSTTRASLRLPRRRLLAACAMLALAGCSDSGGGSGGGSTPTPTPTPTTSAATSPSGSPSASGSASAGGSSTVVIQNFAFSPSSMTVAPGTKITVMNKDSVTHTLTAITGKAFNTGDIAAGKSATFTAPNKGGKFDYMCTIHPFMKGTLTVS